MPQLFFSILLLFVAEITSLSAQNQIEVDYYNEKIILEYDPSINLTTSVRLTEESMIRYFKMLEETEYVVLLKALQGVQEEKMLNDWLFYELLDSALQRILISKSELRRTLTSWFLLSKAGFETRLTYANGKAFIYVYTTEELFEVPMVEDDKKTFANLTSIGKNDRSKRSLYLLDFVPKSEGRPFRFYLSQLPAFTVRPESKQYEFIYQHKKYQLDLTVDGTARAIMKDYPLMHETQYLEIPLSNTTAQSLMPQMEKLIADKSPKEAVELMVAFTRSSFKYKEDKAYFGKSKPMIPEEVFLYTYSDCEDRVALLYTLVKNLLDLPMVVIAFDDHLTLGISIPEMKGDAVRYNGKTYYFCDPTGPIESHNIGEVPNGYAKKSFEIIGAYEPALAKE